MFTKKTRMRATTKNTAMGRKTLFLKSQQKKFCENGKCSGILEQRPERDSDLAESIRSRSDACFSGNVLLSYVKWTSSVLWAVLGELGFE